MNNADDGHSIENEPHLSGQAFDLDPSERRARMQIRRDTHRETLDDHVEHTVWDEPSLSRQLSSTPAEDAITYSNWLTYRCEHTSIAATWLCTFLIALTAGPIAILTAFAEGGATGFQLVMLTIFGPLVEETGKIAGAMWVVERRPYFFSSRFQIFVCSLAGGFCFAIIENLLYLYVYVPDPPAELVYWRWTVCVGLHSGCSMIAGIGLQNVWTDTMLQKTRPHLLTAAPYLVTAIVIHGVYNGSVVLVELSGFIF